MSALCFSPSAACSYFSTSVIYLWSFVTFGVSGWVEVSFSWSTMVSTSSIRSFIYFVVFSQALMVVSILFSCYWGALDLVARWVAVSSVLALSSALVILSIKSSTTFSRCEILDCCSLFTASWSSISRCSYWTSFSSSFMFSERSLILSSCSSRMRTAASPIRRTFSSSWFPACWTCLIFASASFFQALSSF